MNKQLQSRHQIGQELPRDDRLSVAWSLVAIIGMAIGLWVLVWIGVSALARVIL